MAEAVPAAETATLVCGYVGGVTLAICLVPQLFVMWRRRSADDISLPWLILYCIGLALSLAYVVYIAALAAYIPMAIELVLTLVTLLSKLYLDRYGSTAQAAAEAGEGDAPLTLPGPHGSVHGGALAAVEGSHHARVSLAIGRLSSAIPRSPPCPHCGYAQHHNPSRHGPKAGDRSGSGKGPRSSAPRLLQQQQQHHPLSHTAGNAGPSPAGEVAVSSAGSPANGSHHGLVSGPGAGAGADGMHSRARPVGLYDVQVHHP